MRLREKRAHGVTPGLSQDYAERTAEHQAAFLLPYLRPGMDLLDVGCGPGTITLGLAQAVAPGEVVGIDRDAAEIEAARRLAAERGIGNVRFEMGDALMQRWQQSRGSDITLGEHLPTILREAGFAGTIKSVSADTKGTIEETRAHAQITISLLDGPFGRTILEKGWGDEPTIGRLKETIRVWGELAGHSRARRSSDKETIRVWGEHPDAFFANVHVDVVGWKPG